MSPRSAPPVRARVRLIQRSLRPGDPVRETPDPSPRAILTHRMILGLRRDFERGVPVTLDATERDERFRQFAASRVPEPAGPIVEAFFEGPGSILLAACESRWGAMRSIEAFRMADGSVAYLAAFDTTVPTAPVSIWREHNRYTVALWQRRAEGEGFKVAWALDLDDLFPSVLEIDDAQVDSGGTLYVNASYQSYSREVGGQTAFLYAIDPRESRVVWRAGPLVSRGEILIDDDVIVAGYGFTAEPDHLFALDRGTGVVLSRLRIPSAHDRLRKVGDAIHVATYDADLVVELVR